MGTAIRTKDQEEQKFGYSYGWGYNRGSRSYNYEYGRNYTNKSDYDYKYSYENTRTYDYESIYRQGGTSKGVIDSNIEVGEGDNDATINVRSGSMPEEYSGAN